MGQGWRGTTTGMADLDGSKSRERGTGRERGYNASTHMICGKDQYTAFFRTNAINTIEKSAQCHAIVVIAPSVGRKKRTVHVFEHYDGRIHGCIERRHQRRVTQVGVGQGHHTNQPFKISRQGQYIGRFAFV